MGNIGKSSHLLIRRVVVVLFLSTGILQSTAEAGAGIGDGLKDLGGAKCGGLGQAPCTYAFGDVGDIYPTHQSSRSSYAGHSLGSAIITDDGISTRDALLGTANQYSAAQRQTTAELDRLEGERNHLIKDQKQLALQEKTFRMYMERGLVGTQAQPGSKRHKEWRFLAGRKDNVISDGEMTIGQVYAQREEWEKRLKQRAVDIFRAAKSNKQRATGNLDSFMKLGQLGTQATESAASFNSLMNQNPTNVGGDGPQSPFTGLENTRRIAFDTNSESRLDSLDDGLSPDDPLGKTAKIGRLSGEDLSDDAKELLALNGNAAIATEIEREHLMGLKKDLDRIQKEDNTLELVRLIGKEARIPELANVESFDELKNMNDKLEQIGIDRLLEDKLGENLDEDLLTPEELAKKTLEGDGSLTASAFAAPIGGDESNDLEAAINSVIGGIQGMFEGLKDTDIDPRAITIAARRRVAGASRSLVNSDGYADNDGLGISDGRVEPGIGDINEELFSRARAAHWRAFRAGNLN